MKNEEQIVRMVKLFGNGAHVFVPKDWTGEEIVLIKPRKKSLKERIISSLDPYLDSIIGVYLYGSYARSEEKKDSDIDLFVIIDKKIKIKAEGFEIICLEQKEIEKAIKLEPLLMYSIFSEAKRSIFPSFSLSKQEMLSVQDYRAPIAWLDTNELEPKAIWADDNISRYIPYLSKHYVLYPGLLNAHFYIMPTSEIHERYLISRYFQNPNLEILRREYVYYAGSYFDYKMNDLNLRHRICAIVKLSNNFCQEQFVQSLVSQKDRDIMAVYQLEKTSIRPHINEYLRKYGVSYFIRDIAQNPVQTRFVSMVPVYTDGRFEIYKIDIR